MSQNDIARNLKDVNQWIRALYMLLFAVILYVVGIVLLVLVVVQALFAVLTGKPNVNLKMLGASVSIYIHQAVDYLTYNGEEKPFPFSDWPKVTPAPERESESTAEPAAPVVDNTVADEADDKATGSGQ